MSSPDNPASPTLGNTGHDGSHVHVRVTYLHAGNPRPPHDLGAVPVNTTIEALKIRLQTELLETPAPQEQRLIYQGRPLLQDGMTLKEALRLEGPVGPLPYTLHIIIQPRHAAPHFRPHQPADAPHAAVAGSPLPQMPHMPQMPQNPHLITAQDAHNHALRVQAMAQAQLSMLQQQLTQMTQQHGLNPQHGHTFSATFINGQPVPPLADPQAVFAQAGHPTATAPIPAPSQVPDVNRQANAALLQAHPQIQAQHRLQQNMPINGLLNPGLAAGHAPLPRPLSVPPLPRPLEPHPLGMFPPHPPMAVPPFAGLPFPPIRGFAAHPPQPTTPTVWLASSRNGPEAILFSPSHGLFSSNPTRRGEQVRQVQEVHNARTTNVTRTTTAIQDPEPQPAEAAGAAAPGQLALRQPNQAGAQPAPARPAANRNQNEDLMGLIIQRGWLFLRLYMFTYVLSEPNTWRRYLLLSFALLVCLLPRENPLNRILGAARRHVDNLIGPPQARPQPQPQAARAAAGVAQPAADQNATPRPTPARGTVTTTPEEAAARILRERAATAQRQRNANPNVLRDLFYRIEQAIALFLASLVPGVGERHVAAREEQRRLEIEAEAQAQAQVQAQAEGAAGSGATQTENTTTEGGLNNGTIGTTTLAANTNANTNTNTNANANTNAVHANDKISPALTSSTSEDGAPASQSAAVAADVAHSQAQSQSQTEGSSSTGVDVSSTSAASSTGTGITNNDTQLRSRQVGAGSSTATESES